MVLVTMSHNGFCPIRWRSHFRVVVTFEALQGHEILLSSPSATGKIRAALVIIAALW